MKKEDPIDMLGKASTVLYIANYRLADYLVLKSNSKSLLVYIMNIEF